MSFDRKMKTAKIHKETQRNRDSQNILENKEQGGGFIVADFKKYYSYMKQTTWCCQGHVGAQ